MSTAECRPSKTTVWQKRLEKSYVRHRSINEATNKTPQKSTPSHFDSHFSSHSPVLSKPEVPTPALVRAMSRLEPPGPRLEE